MNFDYPIPGGGTVRIREVETNKFSLMSVLIGFVVIALLGVGVFYLVKYLQEKRDKSQSTPPPAEEKTPIPPLTPPPPVSEESITPVEEYATF